MPVVLSRDKLIDRILSLDPLGLLLSRCAESYVLLLVGVGTRTSYTAPFYFDEYGVTTASYSTGSK